MAVVRGLALGTDPWVLGTGLDEHYSPGNRDLQDEIGRDDLLVPQFPPSSLPTERSFPQGNRTKAPISNAVVIVEAGELGGAHHAGWEALRVG